MIRLLRAAAPSPAEAVSQQKDVAGDERLAAVTSAVVESVVVLSKLGLAAACLCPRHRGCGPRVTRGGCRFDGSARDAFSRLLLGLTAESEEQHARGCLLLSANLERETSDAVIAQFLRENQAAVEKIFADAITQGQARGELSKTLDPQSLARFFAATIQGMRAMARLKSDRRGLRQVARVALASLDTR